MTLYKNKYRVESARLPGWDYSTPGFYFVTVCTHDRRCLFGCVKNGVMHSNHYGHIVYDEWLQSFHIRRELRRDEFIVMPNHFHGIVQLVNVEKPVSDNVTIVVETSGRTSLQQRVKQPKPPRLSPKSISSFMAGVKSAITKRINTHRNTPGAPVLQFRFHDHVIRDKHELYRIRHYIKTNPVNWNCDGFGCGGIDSIVETSGRTSLQ